MIKLEIKEKKIKVKMSEYQDAIIKMIHILETENYPNRIEIFIQISKYLNGKCDELPQIE